VYKNRAYACLTYNLKILFTVSGSSVPIEDSQFKGEGYLKTRILLATIMAFVGLFWPYPHLDLLTLFLLPFTCCFNQYLLKRIGCK